jgi:predicted NBD/HSP70 family sugar kinase
METTPGINALSRLRGAHAQALLAALDRRGPLSRADLARHTGLASSTISSLTRELLDRGLLAEEPRSQHVRRLGSGRPPILLRRAGPPGVLVGIDLGHTHIGMGVADPDGRLLVDRRDPYDANDDPQQTLDLITTRTDALLDQAGSARSEVQAVGLGIPGPVDVVGRMSSSILPRWRGVQPGRDLERRIGLCPHVDNDARMGALGELLCGAGRGLEHIIYVKASTGLGAGVVVSGRVVHGGTGIAGELGHVQVDETGAVCRCGSRGCLETQVSAPRLVSLLQPAHTTRLTVEAMLELAAQGDAGVNRVLGDAGRSIGRVLADIVNVLNPQRIIVGGLLGSSTTLVDRLRDAVERYAQPNAALAVSVVPSELAHRAELLGAVMSARIAATALSLN